MAEEKTAEPGSTDDEHTFSFEEYVDRFDPDYRRRNPDSEQFAPTLAKDTLDILGGRKPASQ